MNHLIFVRLAYIPNFRPLVPSFMLKSLWWVGVKTWILVLSFKPKLNKNTEYEEAFIHKQLYVFISSLLTVPSPLSSVHLYSIHQLVHQYPVHYCQYISTRLIVTPFFNTQNIITQYISTHNINTHYIST